MKKLIRVALGGTFDRIHRGHEALIELAAEMGKELVIGVTKKGFGGDKKLKELILPYSTRVEELEKLLAKKRIRKYRLIELEDVYGTTLSDKSIEGVVVSRQTVEGARMVNKRRKKLGLKELPVAIAEMVVDGEGEYLSSSKIREGRINREGIVWLRILEPGWRLRMSDREVFARPAGKMMSDVLMKKKMKKIVPTRLAVVGDLSVARCLKLDLGFDVAVVDGLVGRKKVKDMVELPGFNKIAVRNDAGGVSKEVVEVLGKQKSWRKLLVSVEGEEDLLVLPLILGLPLLSVVVYGQPNRGSVMIEVTEAEKEKWWRYLSGAL